MVAAVLSSRNGDLDAAGEPLGVGRADDDSAPIAPSGIAFQGLPLKDLPAAASSSRPMAARRTRSREDDSTTPLRCSPAG